MFEVIPPWVRAQHLPLRRGQVQDTKTIDKVQQQEENGTQSSNTQATKRDGSHTKSLFASDATLRTNGINAR